MLVTALVISWLAERVRVEAVAARTREKGTAAMFPMSAELLDAKTVADVVTVVGRQVQAAFGAEAVVLLRQPGGNLDAAGRDPGVAQWAFDTWETAGAGTAHFPDARDVYLPLVGSHGRLGVLEVHADDRARFADPAVRWLLQTFAGQAALALERVRPAA
jgi:two-component system sensor histidine kinase KdpD